MTLDELEMVALADSLSLLWGKEKVGSSFATLQAVSSVLTNLQKQGQLKNFRLIMINFPFPLTPFHEEKNLSQHLILFTFETS